MKLVSVTSSQRVFAALQGTWAGAPPEQQCQSAEALGLCPSLGTLDWVRSLTAGAESLRWWGTDEL